MLTRKMTKVLMYCFIISLSVKMVVGAYRVLKFEKFPSTANFDGLGCALEKNSRGVSIGSIYGANTGRCESVSESGLLNQTLDVDETLFKLHTTWNLYPEKKSYVDFPGLFANGTSIIVYVHIGDVKGINEKFVFEIQRKHEWMVCLHMKSEFKLFLGLNSYQGSWGTERIEWSNPFNESNKSYTMIFDFTESAIEVYVDTRLVYTFPHRIPISECDELAFYTKMDAYLLEVQQLYPF